MSQNMVMNEGAAQVRELRDATGAGVMDCKRALAEAKGDFGRAKDLLRKRGFEIARNKSGRATTEGQIFSYVHLGGHIGVMVEINCETDFVARNAEFQQFGRDVAMQIAASHPHFVSRQDIDPKWLEQEKEAMRAEVKGKPRELGDRIIQGQLEKRFQEVCLLDQKFIKDDQRTVQQLLTELISKVGENVVIKRFRRFEVSSE